MSEVKKMDVVINGIGIPLKIKPEEEAIVKRLATEINSKLIELRKQFDISEKDRVYSMLLLSYAMELDRLKRKYADIEADNQDISARLDAITKQIVDALK